MTRTRMRAKQLRNACGCSSSLVGGERHVAPLATKVDGPPLAVVTSAPDFASSLPGAVPVEPNPTKVKVLRQSRVAPAERATAASEVRAKLNHKQLRGPGKALVPQLAEAKAGTAAQDPDQASEEKEALRDGPKYDLLQQPRAIIAPRGATGTAAGEDGLLASAPGPPVELDDSERKQEINLDL